MVLLQSVYCYFKRGFIHPLKRNRNWKNTLSIKIIFNFFLLFIHNSSLVKVFLNLLSINQRYLSNPYQLWIKSFKSVGQLDHSIFRYSLSCSPDWYKVSWAKHQKVKSMNADLFTNKHLVDFLQMNFNVSPQSPLIRSNVFLCQAPK